MRNRKLGLWQGTTVPARMRRLDTSLFSSYAFPTLFTNICNTTAFSAHASLRSFQGSLVFQKPRNRTTSDNLLAWNPQRCRSESCNWKYSVLISKFVSDSLRVTQNRNVVKEQVVLRVLAMVVVSVWEAQRWTGYCCGHASPSGGRCAEVLAAGRSGRKSKYLAGDLQGLENLRLKHAFSQTQREDANHERPWRIRYSLALHLNFMSWRRRWYQTRLAIPWGALVNSYSKRDRSRMFFDLLRWFWCLMDW